MSSPHSDGIKWQPRVNKAFRSAKRGSWVSGGPRTRRTHADASGLGALRLVARPMREDGPGQFGGRIRVR
jgi:hypothetical protein